MKPQTITTSTAGKYARRTTKAGTSSFETMGETRMTTSQFVAITKVPISGTTELSPIVEVLNMADYTHNTVSVVPISEPIFQASPSSVVIREFQPQETLKIEICLRNNDNVARRVKMTQPESPCFSVELTNKKPASKVAPGMDVSYTLSFTPEERTDYFCDLVCFTEREKFIIPVRAIGPRGWLDFPDQIYFERAPVKSETLKTVLVRNVGEARCTFNILSKAPFNATPQSASLSVGDSMQIHFSFSPETTDMHYGEFQVDYGSGETIYVMASGKGEELSVRLDSHALLMDPTYVSLFSQKSFKIINNSDETVTYSFKQLASAAEELRARMRLGSTFDQEQDFTMNNVDYDDFFRNESFQLTPSQGQVWPNSEVEITATFTPSTATEIACVAYCDVAGKANRFPVHLQGTGIGAKIVLSYNVIDIGEVFINSVSEYEVELENQGEIDAYYEMLHNDTLFGSKFSFQPSKGSLGVSQKEHVKVSFSSDVLGEFNEEFEWNLQGTLRPLRLSLRGKVIGPTFHLDEQTLDFKRVSVAFLNTRCFHLFNTADIPFRFHMRVPGDGILLKKEFEVVPSTGTILPHGKQKIQVIDVCVYVCMYGQNVHRHDSHSWKAKLEMVLCMCVCVCVCIYFT
jgi:hydrocephalus-inducing protein